MNIVQRGNPNILKSIQESSKAVSERLGYSGMSVFSDVRQRPQYPTTSPPPRNVTEHFMSEPMRTQNTPSHNTRPFNFEKRALSQIYESIESLPTTREFFNAAQSLFTLYAMDSLTPEVLRQISPQDLHEIKSVVHEFERSLHQ